MTVEMENWKGLVSNAEMSEIWDLGLLHLDVLEQKAQKNIFSEKRVYNTYLDKPGFGRKKKTEVGVLTLLPCDNAFFVQILLYVFSWPTINSVRRNCSFTVWEMSCALYDNEICVCKNTNLRNPFLPQF